MNDSVYSPSQHPYNYSQVGYAPTDITDSRAREHRILGLRAATFWLLLALGVVIVAAAVGGGVGGSIAVNNAKTSCLQSSQCLSAAAGQNSSGSSTTTSSAASSSSGSSTTSTGSSTAAATRTTAWGPLVTALPFTGCPDNNNTVYTTTISGSKFQIVCGKDIPYTGTSDLLAAVVPTFQLCMEMCGSWNDIGKKNGNATVPCKGVAFIPAHVNGDSGGAPIDCVLKSYASNFVVNPGYVVDSAILMS
jgi:hypothetical protein